MNSLKQWRYPTGLVARDLRLDFLRGYCLVVMIIDHVGLFPAWTIGLTGGGRLWVTAAEGFVLISGMVMGMMYPRLIAQRGWHWAIRHVARRAAGLFAITVIGQIIYNTGDFVLRATRGRPTGVPDNYFTLIEEAVFQSRMAPVHLALLPVFIFLMFWGLGVLYVLAQGGWRWALLGSIALWYAAQLNATMFTFVSTSFRLPSWQLLFTIGLLAGYYHVALRGWWQRLPAYHWRTALLIGSGIGLLLLSYQVSFNGLWADVDWLRIDGPVFQGFLLKPGRLIVALWVFAAFYQLLTVCWQPLRRALGWLLLPLGQHSLTAFVLHTLAVYSVQRLPGWPFPDHDPAVMGFVHLAIVLAIWGGTLVVVQVRLRWALRRAAPTRAPVRAE